MCLLGSTLRPSNDLDGDGDPEGRTAMTLFAWCSRSRTN
jgi:hypothetical protein